MASHSDRIALANPYAVGAPAYPLPDRTRPRSRAVRRALALGAMTAGMGVVAAGAASADEFGSSGPESSGGVLFASEDELSEAFDLSGDKAFHDLTGTGGYDIESPDLAGLVPPSPVAPEPATPPPVARPAATITPDKAPPPVARPAATITPDKAPPPVAKVPTAKPTTSARDAPSSVDARAQTAPGGQSSVHPGGAGTAGQSDGVAPVTEPVGGSSAPEPESSELPSHGGSADQLVEPAPVRSSPFSNDPRQPEFFGEPLFQDAVEPALQYTPHGDEVIATSATDGFGLGAPPFRAGDRNGNGNGNGETLLALADPASSVSLPSGGDVGRHQEVLDDSSVGVDSSGYGWVRADGGVGIELVGTGPGAAPGRVSSADLGGGVKRVVLTPALNPDGSVSALIPEGAEFDERLPVQTYEVPIDVPLVHVTSSTPALPGGPVPTPGIPGLDVSLDGRGPESGRSGTIGSSTPEQPVVDDPGRQATGSDARDASSVGVDSSGYGWVRADGGVGIELVGTGPGAAPGRVSSADLGGGVKRVVVTPALNPDGSVSALIPEGAQFHAALPVQTYEVPIDTPLVGVTGSTVGLPGGPVPTLGIPGLDVSPDGRGPESGRSGTIGSSTPEQPVVDDPGRQATPKAPNPLLKGTVYTTLGAFADFKIVEGQVLAQQESAGQPRDVAAARGRAAAAVPLAALRAFALTGAAPALTPCGTDAPGQQEVDGNEACNAVAAAAGGTALAVSSQEFARRVLNPMVGGAISTSRAAGIERQIRTTGYLPRPDSPLYRTPAVKFDIPVSHLTFAGIYSAYPALSLAGDYGLQSVGLDDNYWANLVKDGIAAGGGIGGPLSLGARRMMWGAYKWPFLQAVGSGVLTNPPSGVDFGPFADAVVETCTDENPVVDLAEQVVCTPKGTPPPADSGSAAVVDGSAGGVGTAAIPPSLNSSTLTTAAVGQPATSDVPRPVTTAPNPFRHGAQWFDQHVLRPVVRRVAEAERADQERRKDELVDVEWRGGLLGGPFGAHTFEAGFGDEDRGVYDATTGEIDAVISGGPPPRVAPITAATVEGTAATVEGRAPLYPSAARGSVSIPALLNLLARARG